MSDGRPAKMNKKRDGKRNKGRSNGTRTFVTSAEDLAMRDRIEAQKQAARRRRREEDGEDGDESGSGSEDDEEGAESEEREVLHAVKEEGSDEEAPRSAPKPKGIEGLIEVQNPNMIRPDNKVMKAKDMKAGVTQQLSRREKEALEKERKAADYQRRHLAGETEEARKDIERLRLVKQRREDAARRKVEEDEVEKERSAMKKSTKSSANDVAILDARAIKNMNPSVIKDHLQERGLSIQGQKKELMQRLIDYENGRSL